MNLLPSLILALAAPAAEPPKPTPQAVDVSFRIVKQVDAQNTSKHSARALKARGQVRATAPALPPLRARVLDDGSVVVDHGQPESRPESPE